MKEKKRFADMKTKIILSTLIPVIICLALIFSFFFASLMNALHDTAEAKLLDLSGKYSGRFESKIGEAVNYLTIVASELELYAASGDTDRETLQRSLLRVFGDYGLIDGSSVYFEPDAYDGLDAYYRGTDYGTETSGRICWYFYMDNGATAYLPEGLEGDIEFDLPHYKEAQESNARIYTNPTVYEIEGIEIPMFTITYPIRNVEGMFIGAVTVDLFLDDIYKPLQEESIYETGYILVVNDKGYILYSPRYEDIGRTREEAGLTYDLPGGESPTSFFNARSIINGEETLMMVDIIHIPALESHLFLSISVPLSEINADGTRIIVYFSLFTLFVLAAIIVLLYVVIGRMYAPLNEIKESLNQIAGGDYNARVTGSFTGEFAVIKDSVNSMAESIRAYIMDSEDTVGILESILNGMDAYLYVSDPVTDEILFINDNMKRHFDIADGGVGQICWQVLQSGFDKRCEFCPCYKLDGDPDTPVVWEEHNTVTNRYYRNTDRYIEWLDGRKAHLQHSVDITDIKMASIALDKRLDQQAIMASISQSFLSDIDMEMLIDNALRVVGEFIGVSQILLYRVERDGEAFTCRNEWIDPSLRLGTRLGGMIPMRSSFISLLSGVKDITHACFTSDEEDVRAVMAPFRQSFGSYITAPVYLKGKLYAALDFSRNDDGRHWTRSDKSLVTFLASLLSGVFDRSSMEEQLRGLSSIVESSPQFIMDLTTEGDIEYVNPGAALITGYSIEDIRQGGIIALFEEQVARDIRESYIPKTVENGTFNFEIELIRRDGQKRIMAFSSFMAGRGAVHVGCIASDVTEIRRLEADLIAAKEAAEQGSRSKSEFLSRMSHEMRTPMNAIIGMTNIAKGSGDVQKKEYCLDRIDNASHHLLGVINDILDMSKIEANKFELSFSEFSFEKMLMNVLNVVNFRVEEKRQKLSIYIDPAMPGTIIGDEQRLAQVITNLLTNAAKFTPEEGTIQLDARITERDGDMCILRVEIADSGIGISKQQQAKLFRSFEQADGSIARKFGGTGLGLAISKRIVNLMDGDIWVESELGEGSRFIFTIKAEQAAVTADARRRSVDLSTISVLVVDDSDEVRDYFKHIMDGMGIACTVAADGEEALALVKDADAHFDIAFVDWNMPGMNGIDVTRHIKSLCDKHVIVIMISVAEWSDIQRDAQEAGVNGFIPKPLFPSALMDCINAQLSVEEDETPEAAETTGEVSLEGKVALLAEDVDINREIVLTVLEETGLIIDCAEDGRQAIELFAANPGRYDIIFMDVHMPEVDGLEATRRIRAMGAPEGQSVPIVAMTANVFREDIQRCLDAGMNDHIGKPIDFDELRAKIGKYI